MSNPNVNLSNLDARYASPAQVDTKVSSQAAADAQQYVGQLIGLASGTAAAAANTTAIQAAIDAALASGGGTVRIPKGVYYTNPLVMKTRVRLIGQGWGSRLILAANTNTHFITLAGIQTEQTSIENLWLDGNKANQTAGDIIRYDNTNYDQGQANPSLGDPNHTMHRVVLWGAKEHGLHLVGSLGQGQYEKVLSYRNGKNGFRIEAPDNQFISCIAAVNGWDGFYLASNSLHLINPKSWLSGDVDSSQGSGYVIANVGRITMTGSESQDNRQHGYSLNGAYDCKIDGTADRNGIGPEPAHSGGQGDGIYIGYSSRNMIDLVTGDRDTANPMTRWAYNAGSSNDANMVRITSGLTKSGVLGVGSFGLNSDVALSYNGVRQPAPSKPRQINLQSGSTYTPVATDAGGVIELSAAVTVTIPLNSSVAYPIGTELELFQVGTGTVTIAPASGVTLDSRGGALKLAGQYATAALRKRASDEWVVVGDITT